MTSWWLYAERVGNRRGFKQLFFDGLTHYCDIIMGAMASQITSLTIVFSIVHSGADYRKHRKHQSSASLAFVRRIHRWPVNSPHKWPVTRKMFAFVDVITNYEIELNSQSTNQAKKSIMELWCRFSMPARWASGFLGNLQPPIILINLLLMCNTSLIIMHLCCK